MPQLAGNPKPIDPNVAVPAAVRRQAEAADRMQREMTAQQPQPPEPQPPPPPPVPPVAPPQEPEHAPQASPPVMQQAGDPPRPEPAPGPEGGAPEEPPPDDQSWKDKFHSQVGRTRKLQSDVMEMSSRIDELQRLLSATATQPAPSQAAASTFEPLLTPEERTEWAEVLPVMEKRFKELYAPIQDQFQNRIDSLEKQLTTQSQRTGASTRAQMYQMLDVDPVLGANSPTYWRMLNDDDSFVQWLQYPDMMSGRKRHALLEEAHGLNDAGRMAAIFRGFLREAGLAVDPQPSPKPNGAAAAPTNGLERYAAPGPARTAPAPAASPAATEILDPTEIARFFADKRAQKWNGREAEAKAIEERIFAAGREGRVRAKPNHFNF